MRKKSKKVREKLEIFGDRFCELGNYFEEKTGKVVEFQHRSFVGKSELVELEIWAVHSWSC